MYTECMWSVHRLCKWAKLVPPRPLTVEGSGGPGIGGGCQTASLDHIHYMYL